MKNEKPFEKFTDGMNLMLISKENLQKRLIIAYENHIFRVDPNELPKEKRDQYIEIQKQLSSIKSENELDENKAQEIADDLFQIYLAVINDFYSP